MKKALRVEDLLSQIQQLTGELNFLRTEICSHVFTAEEPHGPSLFSTSSESLEVMARLKAEIDDLRHIVWIYLEAMAEYPMASADQQRKLLDRATEILGVLSHRPPLPMPDRPVGEHSLMDRLLQLIDNRIDPRSRA
jgi:hypothetical protein